MNFSILFVAILGVLTGSLTGLTPGIHVNTAIAFISVQKSYFTTQEFITFIVCASIAHTFLDVIPTVFLGIPDESLAVAVYPAHEMTLDGRGVEAASISAFSGVISTLISIPAMFLFFAVLPKIPLKEVVFPVLILVFLFMILSEKPETFAGKHSVWLKRLYALLIFLLSGLLGVLAFKMENLVKLTSASTSLIPLFMGLFAFPILVAGILRKSNIPDQNFKLSFPDTLSSISGTLAGFLVSIFPGISSGVASALAVSPFRERDAEKYISATGAANTANAILCFAVLASIGKARSGAAVALKSYKINLLTLSALSVFSAILSAFMVLIFTVVVSKFVGFLKVNVLCAVSLIFVLFVVLYLTGAYGLLLFSLSSIVGLLPSKLEVRRIHCMGCIIFPVLLLYMGLL